MFDKCIILGLIFVPHAIRSFTLQNPIANNKNVAFTRIVNSKLEMSKEVPPASKSETSRRAFASSTFASIMITCGSVDNAFAQGYESLPSIQVSEQIKTMDFSLPSSYDSIKSSKSTTDILLDIPDEETKTSAAVSAKKKKSVGLPSLDDGSSKKEKKVKTKELTSFNDGSNKKEKKVKTKELTSLNGGSNKKEKKAKTKEIVKEDPEEKEKVVNQKITIVDLELPSYGDSTKGKEKSVFAF